METVITKKSIGEIEAALKKSGFELDKNGQFRKTTFMGRVIEVSIEFIKGVDLTRVMFTDAGGSNAAEAKEASKFENKINK